MDPLQANQSRIHFMPLKAFAAVIYLIPAAKNSHAGQRCKRKGGNEFAAVSFQV